MSTDDRALADLIAELRGLLAKATPGRWAHWPNGHPTIIAVPEDRGWGHKEAIANGKVIADFPFSGNHTNDSALTAAAKEALPTLLDRLEAFHAKPQIDATAEARIRELVLWGFRERKSGNEVTDAIVSALAALQSPPPVVSPDEAVIAVAHRLLLAELNEACTEQHRRGILRLEDGPVDGAAAVRAICNALAAVSTAPVVEEGRREAAIDAVAALPQARSADSVISALTLDDIKTIADAILALTPVEGVGGDVINTLRMVRNTVGDLKNGFAMSVDPARWVEQLQAAIDAALSTPVAAQGDKL